MVIRFISVYLSPGNSLYKSWSAADNPPPKSSILSIYPQGTAYTSPGQQQIILPPNHLFYLSILREQPIQVLVSSR